MIRSAAVRLEAAAADVSSAALRLVTRNDDVPAPLTKTEDVSNLLTLLGNAVDHVLSQKLRADGAEARLDVMNIRIQQWEERTRAVETRLQEAEASKRQIETRAALAEQRAEEMERNLRRAGLAVVEAENRLQRALGEAKFERERSGEVQISAAKTVERMRLLLNDASDQLRRTSNPA